MFRLYLTGYLDLASDLDVVIVVVGVRGDPETALLQSCGEIIRFMGTVSVLRYKFTVKKLVSRCFLCNFIVLIVFIV